MNSRLKSLVQWNKDENIDFTFITAKENVFYLSGFYSEPHERLLSVVVFQESDPILICPALDAEDARNAGWEYDMIAYSDIENPWELLRVEVSKRLKKVNNVALEKEHVTVDRFDSLKFVFGDLSFLSADEKLRSLRVIKDDYELGRLREAARLADFAIETGVKEIQEGKTELDILAAVEFALKKQGVQEMSFSTIVLTGKNAASPHGIPGLSKVKRGDFVLFDLGVIVDGYCSDITRTVAYGEPNEKQLEIYNTVLKAQETAIEKITAGVTCAEVDLAARNVISAAGYGQHFPHRLGHGLGISVHEYPSITETNQLKLQEGMVITIEPGIYVPNVAGVRIEDDIAVTKDGCEILTKYPKHLQIISEN